MTDWRISFTLTEKARSSLQVTVQIPDDIGCRLAEAGGDLSRRALEGLALEEFRSGHITKVELRRLLGFGTRWQLDEFLKAHGVYEDYSLEDFEKERASLRSLGF